MSDLIRRSDAIKEVKKYRGLGKLQMAMLADGIRAIPSVEPKRGEWIRTRFVDCGSPIDECSICGHYINGDMEVRNFCPNCGAEMRGKDNE